MLKEEDVEKKNENNIARAMDRSREREGDGDNEMVVHRLREKGEDD